MFQQYIMLGAGLAIGLTAGNIAGRAQATANNEKDKVVVMEGALDKINEGADKLREAGKLSTLVVRDRQAELRAIRQRADQNDTSDGRTCLVVADSLELRDNYAEIFATAVQSGS